jgi:hypothetical protein
VNPNLFPYPSTGIAVVDIIYGTQWDFELSKRYYSRQHSHEATVFLSQYLYIENQLHETFNYVSPSEGNKNTYSIVFASIIKSSANLFELVSRHIYSELYKCTTPQLKGLKIKQFLSLIAHADYTAIKLSSFHFQGSFSAPEVYEPFEKVKSWDRVSEIQCCHIPEWWTANNKLKHSNVGLAEFGTLQNAIAAVAAVFVVLHIIYGGGMVWGMKINESDQLVESPKSILFSPA